jgi:hypothetical protein
MLMMRVMRLSYFMTTNINPEPDVFWLKIVTVLSSIILIMLVLIMACVVSDVLVNTK